MFAKSLILLAAASSAFGALCQNPTITSETFTTTDAFFHMATTFIAQFTVACSNGEQEAMPLYAAVNGHTMPVAVGEESGKYQISWAAEHVDASSGTYTVTLYDEDNYALLKKAERSNEDVSKVATFGTVSLYHPGASRGRFVSSETVGMLLAAGVFYAAHQYRSGITN